jgi:predicted ester cyclase
MAVNVQEKKTYVSNSAAVRESIASFVKGDFEGATAPFAEDAEVSDPTGKFKGKPQILAQLKVWRTAFPDAKGEVTNQVSEGDKVLTEVTFRGTHTGPLAGAMGTIPPARDHIAEELVLAHGDHEGGAPEGVLLLHHRDRSEDLRHSSFAAVAPRKRASGRAL